MPRKSAAAAQPKEPASLPDVLIPPSEAPENQRAAYWLDLLQKPDELKAAIASEDFFTMLQEFPDAFWDRFSIYLYRRPDDEGRMVRNAPTQKGKYLPGGVLHHAIQEEDVAKKWGGGKYTAYLKLDSTETVREHTFSIDGPPKVLDGQVVEINGKTVSTGTPAAPPAVASETAQIVAATSAAATANAELLKGGMQSVLDLQTDLTRKQLGLDGKAEKDPLETAIRLVEILRPKEAAPAKSAMTEAIEILDRLDAMAARRNPQPADKNAHDTSLTETLNVVKELTGAESIAELLKPAARNVAAATTPEWVSPLLELGKTLISAFPAIMAQSRATRDLEFRRMLFLRDMKPGQAPPAALLNEPAPPTPQSTTTQPPATNGTGPLLPQDVVTGMVTMICDGFDRDPRQGMETAAAIAFNFAQAIESLGYDKTLGSEAEVAKFVAGLPPLQQRSQDARWPMFAHDFLSYTIDRWGTDEEQERWQAKDSSEEAGDREKPPAA
jgi:hypothetical protein